MHSLSFLIRFNKCSISFWHSHCSFLYSSAFSSWNSGAIFAFGWASVEHSFLRVLIKLYSTEAGILLDLYLCPPQKCTQHTDDFPSTCKQAETYFHLKAIQSTFQALRNCLFTPSWSIYPESVHDAIFFRNVVLGGLLYSWRRKNSFAVGYSNTVWNKKNTFICSCPFRMEYQAPHCRKSLLFF